MTGSEFGDVVLVPFPFTDQSAAKKRPAVVISSRSYNNARPDNGKRAVTAETALLLAKILGTSPEFWLNLQMSCDLYAAMHRRRARTG
ncbi:MAG: plasmid maintenance system antidote [Planctomycetota bacterium]|nr:MAG: plasmid maintenance system antidote [Planctomycetota bacterium]